MRCSDLFVTCNVFFCSHDHASPGALSEVQEGARAQPGAMVCSAAVPHRFLCLLFMYKLGGGAERWHCDSEVAALRLDFKLAPHVVAIPVVLEQSPVCRGDSVESEGALAPAFCQPLPFPHVGLRSPQLLPFCLLRCRDARLHNKVS